MWLFNVCQCWRYEHDYGPMPALWSDTSSSELSSSDENENIPIYLLSGINVSGVKSLSVSKKTLRREKQRRRMQEKRKDSDCKAHEQKQ